MTEPNPNENKSDKEEKKKTYVDRFGRSALLKELERHIDWKMQDARMRGCSPCLDLAVLTVASGRMLVTGVYTRGTTVYLDIRPEMVLQYNRLDIHNGMYNTPRPNTRSEDPPTRAIDLPTLIHKLDLMSGEEVRFPDGSFIAGITMLSQETPFPMPAIAATSNVSDAVVTLVQTCADEDGHRSHDEDNKSGIRPWSGFAANTDLGSGMEFTRHLGAHLGEYPSVICDDSHILQGYAIPSQPPDDTIPRYTFGSATLESAPNRVASYECGIDPAVGESESTEYVAAAAPASAAAVDPAREAIDSAVREDCTRSDQAFMRTMSEILWDTQAGQTLSRTGYTVECTAERDPMVQDTGEPAGG